MTRTFRSVCHVSRLRIAPVASRRAQLVALERLAVSTATSMTRLACLAPQGGRLRYMTLHVHLTLQDDFKGWWALRFRH